uniref:Uncharacterized protein n=1 Tax=viral metagenome TaxID=1070528 RepID=A0A6M3LV00_9ZZZZ
MKAEDTKMSDEQMMAEIWDLGFGLEGIEGRPPTQKERFDLIANVQAEISFKAGYEQALTDASEKLARLFNNSQWLDK